MEYAGNQTPARVWMAMLDGNYVEAERFLPLHLNDFQDIDLSFYFRRLVSDGGARERRFGACNRCFACRNSAKRLIVKPEHARTIAVLAQVDADGPEGFAIRKRAAIELCDRKYLMVRWFWKVCQIYAWSSDRDRAID
jgi:hypothetical protein